jgi:ATP synthase protein I
MSTPEPQPVSDADRLRAEVERETGRLDAARQARPTLLAHTMYLGALGLAFIIPVVVGAYLGHWLDSESPGYSVRWTLSLLGLGVAVGGVNLYLMIRV